MAAALFHAVPGGGESSDSGEEWDLADNLELKEMQPAVETSEGLLKNALTMGDVKLVQNLLDSGLSIECWFQYGWTPLMYAASVANMEIMRLLLNRGANANFERDSFTVLMAACTAHGSEENIVKCVELLLSRNVDANVCCRKSMTSLMLAAREGYTRVVTLLVAHGAEINAQDGNGFTALTWAAHNGHKNTVLKLIELGADKKLSTKNGNTAADLAKRNNHLEILSILSFSGQPYQESGFTKGEAMYRYLKAQPESTTVSNFGCLASSDLEVFLHGLGLGHLSEVLMENNITLRQLLSLEEGDLRKAGVTDEEDCKKMVSAVGEIQVEETKLGTLPVLSNAESSGDELFAFLLKLNRQCSSLTLALEAVSNQIPANPQKVVLEWDSSQNILPVCEDLVTSVLNLGKEVGRLQELLQKGNSLQPKNTMRDYFQKTMGTSTSLVRLESLRYMGAVGSSSSSSRVMCNNVPGLVTRQRQLCQRYPEIMNVIGLGVHEWTAECQHQFRHHRWNCNTHERDQSLFGKLILHSSRESAFVYAISSAGVVFAVTRACSQGELKSCSCDPNKKGHHKDDKGSFDWGGCSDDIDYGIKFARAFVDAKEKKGKDARALMNLHNNRAGRKAVKRFMTQECKCHGVSGSCTLRTCWLTMGDFRKTGDYLRKKYNGAIQVVMNQDGTGFAVANKHFKKPTTNDLVYFENSPDYCIRDRESAKPCATKEFFEGSLPERCAHYNKMGSFGTDGRICNQSSRGMDSCEVMCCGRGYDTARVTKLVKCECKFHWCCTVQCRDCLQTVDVHTCKAIGRREDI